MLDIRNTEMKVEMNLLKNDVIHSLKSIVPLFIASFIIGLLLSNRIVITILQASNVNNITMITTQPFEMISMMLSVSFSFALLAVSPLVVWHLFKMLSPALHQAEKKIAIKMIGIGLLLFGFGVTFGYFVFVPISLTMAGSYTTAGIANMWSIKYLFNFILTSITMFGLMFQLPIVISLLSVASIVKSETLKKSRLIVLIGFMIISAWLTPEDMFTMFIMALPLYLLYEISILSSNRIEKRRMKL